MNIDTFFTDHWRDIEDERVERYEQMFLWHDGQAQLLQPAELQAGQRILDVGSGPGFFAGGLRGLVGPEGRVDGVDINARFVSDANARHADDPGINFHHLVDHHLPFADATFDRVICKNVLEYVPDLQATLAEVKRVLKPGGRVQVIDSDWGFVIVQPWDKAQVDGFFQAAAPAFNEPFIGRKVPGLLHDAGLAEVKVRLSPYVDQAGRGLNVLKNMAGYIATFDTLPQTEVASLMEAATQALDDGKFLFCLPQFLITADKL